MTVKQWMCALGLALCATQTASAQTPQENGVAYARAIAAAERTMQAWLRDADPKTGADARSRRRRRRVSTPHNFAADLYPYLILTARLTDPALYEGRMLEMLRNEVRYMTADGSVPGNLDLRTGTLGRAQPLRRGRVRQGRADHGHRTARPHAVVPPHGRPDRRRDGARPARVDAGASCRPSTAS